MFNFMNGVVTFFKRNKSTILSIISAGGVILTSFLSYKAGTRLMEINTQEKTKKERIKEYTKIFTPAVISGTVTVSCIVFTNFLNRRQQIFLSTLCTAWSSKYFKYKDKVIEILGKDANDKVMKELTVEKAKDVHLSYPGILNNLSLETENDDRKQLFYDSFSDRYFESTIDRVLQAEYHLNRNFAIGGFAPLDDYYKFLGLTPFSKSYPNDEEYGWTSSEGYVWIDFSHTKCVLDDGLECYIIDMIFEPVDGYLDM